MKNFITAVRGKAPLWCCISLIAAVLLFPATYRQYNEYRSVKSNFDFAIKNPRPNDDISKNEASAILNDWLEERGLLTYTQLWDKINADREGYSNKVKSSFVALLFLGIPFIIFTFLFIFTLPKTLRIIYTSTRNITQQRIDTPIKRIGIILSALSFIYLIYSFIALCDHGNYDNLERLLYSIGIFIISLSIVLGIPQRFALWVKTGK